LYVRRVPRWRYRVLTHDRVQQLCQQGTEYCRRVEAEISQALGFKRSLIDGHVVVSDDVPKEIVIYANKVRARMIYLGASERSPPQRFFYGNPVEQVLRDANCDVAIYRGIE
jgi:nucleotide-binding universal stress UspA family protein